MDPLNQLQLDQVALLLGNPDLAKATIYKFKEMVVADTAAQDLNIWAPRDGEHSGIAIEVGMPSIRGKYPNVPGPQMVIETRIKIYEDPIVNTTGYTAEGTGLEVLSWLDGQRVIGSTTELVVPDESECLKPNYEFKDRFCYEAILHAQFPRDARARVPVPAIIVSAGLVSLDCEDETAAIYYTTDNSCPVIGNDHLPEGFTAARIYTAPFAGADGMVVRYLAWRAGLLPSFVMTDTLMF